MKRIFVVILTCLAITSCAKRSINSFAFSSGVDDFHGTRWHSTTGVSLIPDGEGTLHISPIVSESRDSTRVYGIEVNVVAQDWLFLYPKSVLEVYTDDGRFVLRGAGSRDNRVDTALHVVANPRSTRSKDYYAETHEFNIRTELAQFNTNETQLLFLANSEHTSFTLRTKSNTVSGKLDALGKQMFKEFYNRHVALDAGVQE